MSKHLTKFDTLTEYNNEKYFLDFPNVSKVNGSVYYLPSMPTDYAILWKDENGKTLGITTCGTTASRPSTVQGSDVYSIEWGSCNSVTTLATEIFYQSKISTVSIPATVTTLGDRVYSHCENITSATIPNTVTTIGVQTFVDCTGLTTATLPNNMTEIPMSMFMRCSSLSSITIPSTVTSIGNTAFQDCTSLTSINLPSGLTSLGTGAFLSTGITSFNIPASVTTIGTNALASPACTTITVDSNNPSFESPSGSNCLFYKGSASVVRGCKGSVIPSNAVGFSESAFAYSGITSIGITGSGANLEIPSRFTTIPRYCFQYNKSLTTVTLPEGITTILGNAFENCWALETITIPSTVTTINAGMLTNYGTSALQSFTCLATTPPTLNGNLFYGNNNFTIYVPAASVSAYKAANWWKDHKNRIQAIPA